MLILSLIINENIMELTTQLLTNIGKDMVSEIIKRKDKKIAFYQSPLKKRMVQDIIRVGKGFDSEQLAYFPEKVKKLFGWQDISNDDINLFLDVMSCEEIDTNTTPTYNENSPFFNYTLQRDGLSIYLVSGQGTIISVEPIL